MGPGTQVCEERTNCFAQCGVLQTNIGTLWALPQSLYVSTSTYCVSLIPMDGHDEGADDEAIDETGYGDFGAEVVKQRR